MTTQVQKRSDPSEQLASLRPFYRDWRPTRLGRFWNGMIAWLVGMGLTPQILVALQVNGRRPLSEFEAIATDYPVFRIDQV